MNVACVSIIRGHWANVDFSIVKDTTIPQLGEAGKLQFRAEAFNLTNHFNWGNPITNFNAGTFGRITTQAGAPRIIQLGFKVDF